MLWNWMDPNSKAATWRSHTNESTLLGSITNKKVEGVDMVAVPAVEEGASVVAAVDGEDTVAAVVSEDEAVGATIHTSLLF